MKGLRISLRALRTFLAIVHHGTFARAGEAVGLTQSAVSLQVKTLEHEFGVELFDRSRRYPALTDAGQIVLLRATEIVAAYDRIPEALSGEHELIGRLRVGAIQTALAGPAPDALVRLKLAHPRLQIKIFCGTSSELAHLVTTGDLDAAITTAPHASARCDLLTIPLYEDDFWIVAPPQLDSDGDLRNLVRNLPFIQFDKRAWAGRIIAGELQRLGIAPHAGMVLDSPEVIVRMVANGLGVAVVALSRHSLHTLPPLSRWPFGTPQIERPVVLLQRREQPTDRFARVLVDEIKAAITSISYASLEN